MDQKMDQKLKILKVDQKNFKMDQKISKFYM